ncbi:uncharacterized protein F5Z01DRAFT_497553 [Emericellopsis atlantica]|uniref:Uncharacterized protein n=1 Tax=Emericellopsis atlantica TaxID=2614577 RepID=A0A9P7ZQF1_9HYPO|nr:uncharacterized protein F5Z01DRAFT_497553 [Emericellopsis atlantica]KAG9256196.1 hypothetical protein F5Z01DRAFT_497553 [Emericellopsis atlantica]
MSITFDPSVDIPALNGNVILITGANAGLGKQAAMDLAKHSPALIIMTSRDESRGQDALEQVKAAAKEGTKVSLVLLDLASFASIKQAAQTVMSQTDRLDVLNLNAGILGAPAGLTEEGYEITMGVNHIGHALFLKLLAPLLEATSKSTGTPSRVLSISSVGWKYLEQPTINFDALNTPDAGLASMQRYMQSKLANVLYAREFAKRHPSVKTVSLHPGEVDTELYSREPGDDFVVYLQKEVAPKRVVPVNEGVKHELWAMTVADEELDNGAYYEPIGIKGRLEKGAADNELASKLWDWTDKELEGHGV